mgnify:CR=1 FL=1|jgi:potassium efflux system protein
MDRFRAFRFERIFRNGKRTIYRALPLFLAFCFAAAVVKAQNQTAPAANAPSAETNASPGAAFSPTPIPFSEVITQAENASSTLKEIAAGAVSDTATQEVARRLPPLTDEINSRLKATAETVEGASSLDNLRGFESDWRTLSGELTDWNDDLTARAKKLETDLGRVDELIEKWQKTRDQLNKAETPAEILARINEIIRTASETRRAILAEQTHVIALQNRVTEQHKRVGEALKTIAARREALVGQLLVQDSPPFWSRDLWTRGQGGIRQNIRQSLTAQLQGLNAFAVLNKDKLIVHALVFVLLAALLFYLRRWARPVVEAQPDLKPSAVIFNLPISTALVLAIFFSSRFYPQTPQILQAIFGAIVLVPTVIILRRIIERPLYPLLYSLVVFYFVDQLRVISEGVPAVWRPLFLAETLCAFLFFWWLYRVRLSAEDAADEKSGSAVKIIRTASLVVLPFFAAAFLANVFGFVNLARIIGDAVLRSAYAAVVLYGAVRILEGLVVFALRFRPLNMLKMAGPYAAEIQEKTARIFRFLALALWIYITLDLFTLRETVYRELKAVLTAELNLGSLSISAFDVLIFFAVVWAAFMLSRLIRFALEQEVYTRFPLPQGIPYAVSTIINYIILLIGFFFAVGAAGFDLTRFTVLVGAFGVGIGFGLQNIFNNFVSGLILLFERPVKVGDEIMVGDASGTVRRIGIRASIIRQWDNSEIIVPNSKLISENVKNWTRSTRKRGVEVPVRVAHGTDAELVIGLLKKVAAEHPLVADTPAPQAFLSELAPLALIFKLRVWTAQTDKASSIGNDLAAAVSKELAVNNIKVPQIPPEIPS